MPEAGGLELLDRVWRSPKVTPCLARRVEYPFKHFFDRDISLFLCGVVSAISVSSTAMVVERTFHRTPSRRRWNSCPIQLSDNFVATIRAICSIASPNSILRKPWRGSSANSKSNCVLPSASETERCLLEGCRRCLSMCVFPLLPIK